jgi:hypothetical protein
MVPGRQTDPKPPIDLIATFALACRRAGLTHDQVARLLKLKPEQLYQQLRLQGHFSLTRLVRLRDDPDGRKFLREYWPLVAHDMGISEVADSMASPMRSPCSSTDAAEADGARGSARGGEPEKKRA